MVHCGSFFAGLLMFHAFGTHRSGQFSLACPGARFVLTIRHRAAGRSALARSLAELNEVTSGSSYAPISHRPIPGFNSLHRVYKRFFQDTLADGPDHQAEQPPLEVLAVAYDDHVDIGQTVGATLEVVGVARCASPRVGIGCRKDDAVGIGPVIMQAFPDAARAFRDVGLGGAAVMHLEVFVGAVAKELRAARPEVGEPGDVLLGRRGGCLVQMDRGHVCSLSHPEIPGILGLVLSTALDTAHTGFFI